jgi:hypothetical protein
MCEPIRKYNRCRPVYDRIICSFFLLLSLTAAVCYAQDFDPGKAGFAVRFKKLVSSYSLMSVFVLPGEKLTLDIANRDRTGSYTLRSEFGRIIDFSEYEWTWQAPETTGKYPVLVYRSGPRDSIMLQVFVMVPHSELKDGYLNGYRIGKYPDIPYRGLGAYKPPRGFVEIRPDIVDTPVSPHFTIRQFVCKQNGDYPKYIVLREALLLKLESILQKVNESGYAANTFAILSGYRTPYYNHAIGNVKYSRHQWGGAADIFIDEHPIDSLMDDLNGDGRNDWRDAAIIYDIIDNMSNHKAYEPFIGGLARYKRTSEHGPFVHVDVRGFRARWGY